MKLVNALNAMIDISCNMENVYKLVLSAKHSIPSRVTACLAIKDTELMRMETAWSTVFDFLIHISFFKYFLN